MASRQRGETPNGFEQAGPLARAPVAPERPPTAKDRLDYIAAMLDELKVMSRQANCNTLAILIGRAHREALRRARAG